MQMRPINGHADFLAMAEGAGARVYSLEDVNIHNAIQDVPVTDVERAARTMELLALRCGWDRDPVPSVRCQGLLKLLPAPPNGFPPYRPRLHLPSGAAFALPRSYALCGSGTDTEV